MKSYREFELTECPLDGIRLIEAAAGTGKTYNIVRLFLRLLVEKGLRVGEILTVTFTRAATEELRERIRSMLRLAQEALAAGRDIPDEPAVMEILGRVDKHQALTRLTKALRDFDEAAVHTIHGFCNRALTEFAFETGTMFDAELIADQDDLIRELILDFWRKNMYTAPEPFVAYALERNLHPDQLVGMLRRCLNQPQVVPVHPPEASLPDNYDDLAELIRTVREGWPQAMNSIEELLREGAAGGILNKRVYSEKTINTVMTEMRYFAERTDVSPLLLPDDKFALLTSSRVTASTNKGKAVPEHPFLEQCEALQNLAQKTRREMDRRIIHLMGELTRDCRAELDRKKLGLNVISYDDLLIHLHRALFDAERGPELVRALRQFHKAALIDEFQDTDAVQWDIFKAIFQGPDSALFLIGDPKQSIYGFRGADIHVYLDAAGQVNDRYTLLKSYRSGSRLVEAVNTIFSANPAPFIHQGISYREMISAGRADSTPLEVDGDQGPPLRIWIPDERRILKKDPARNAAMDSVAGEITRLLRAADAGRAKIGTRAVRPGDMAVLVRKNDEAEAMQMILAERGVRSVIRSDRNLFESREAGQLAVIIRAVESGGGTDLIRAALVTDILGYSGRDLDEMDEKSWTAVALRFHEYREKKRRFGFMHMFQDLLRREGVRKRLLTLPDGERRLTNLLHLGEVLHREGRAKPGNELRLLERDAERNVEEHQIRLESDEDAVQITTVHLSKGLEYAIVFCPFSWSTGGGLRGHLLVHEEKIRFLSSWAMNYIDEFGDDDFLTRAELERSREIARRERLAEELRLFYVALTRAVHRCYLIWGPINDTGESAPAYLMHGEPGMGAGEVRDHFKTLKPEEIVKSLRDLAAKAPDAISAVPMPVTPPDLRYEPGRDENLVLELRDFTGRLQSTREVASYSSLVARAGEMDEEPAPPPLLAPPRKEPDEEKNIMTFPRGAHPGVFFHKILEEADFDASKEDLLKLTEEIAVEFRYEEWAATAAETAWNVLHTPLYAGEEAFTLASVSRANRLEEMEFYFPLASVKRSDLRADFPSSMENPAGRSLLDSVPDSGPAGFMRGYIDLIFRHGEKFYLLDWKSNFLGDRVEDYHESRLPNLMNEESYVLQYYIYLTALDHYLRARLPDYDFDRHVGGVLYLFIRGMSPGRGSEFGVYRDHPTREMLEWFRGKFMAETNPGNREA